MPIDPTTLIVITKAAVDSAITAAVKSLASLATEQRKIGKINDESISVEAIASHIKEVAIWCSSYNFIGLSKPKSVSFESIELSLSSIPRRFRGPKGKTESTEEAALFNQGGAFLLLGDPGSGKTTTLKRIAQRLLTEAPHSDRDTAAFPLLVVLRELPKGTGLCEFIARVIGAQVTKTSEEVMVEIPSGLSGTATRQVKRTLTVYKVGKLPLIDFIAAYLEKSRAIVLIDGLDEVAYDQAEEIQATIRDICRKSENIRLVATCRSGAYYTNFENLTICELLPLSQAQVNQISQFWLGTESRKFLKQLEQLPYRDIVDRPLLLTYLLYLYSVEAELPEQPSSIYRKVVYRLLKEWDEERRIKRHSRYARFDVDRKIDFLSELSYQLTYQVRSKVFSEGVLIKAYQGICRNYRLPKSEYKEVVAEIETHTGILTQNGSDKYEFSHLSLQEFFCGYYLSRAPYPELMREYLAAYTPPIAVACAMSSDPALFLTELVENSRTHGFFKAESIGYFLARLRLENPIFKQTSKFGYAVLYIFAMFYSSGRSPSDKEFDNFLILHGIKGAVRAALKEEGEILRVIRSSEVFVFRIKSERFRISFLFDQLPVKLPVKFVESLRLKYEITPAF